MKALIKLLIAVLLFNAGFQAVRSYYGSLQFKREVHDEALLGVQTTTDQLQQQILTMAAERGYEMAWADVDITRVNNQVIIAMKYVDQVAFVPRFYVRPWAYEAAVEVRRVKHMDQSPPQPR